MAKAHINIREEIADFRKKAKSQSKKDLGEEKQEIATLLKASKENGDFKDLERIIEDQSKELLLRAKTVDALQRNFESLSEFCKSEKQKNQHLVIKVEELTKENERLTQKLKDFSGVKIIVGKHEEADASKSKGLKNDLDALKEQNNSLQRSLKNKETEIEKLEDQLRKTKFEREKLNKELGGMKEKMSGKDKQIKELDQEVHSLTKELSNARETVFQREKEIEETCKEMDLLQAKIEKLTQTLKIKESIVDSLQKKATESEEVIASLKEKLKGYEVSQYSGSLEINQVKSEKLALAKRIEILEEQVQATGKELLEARNSAILSAQQNKELSIKLKTLEESEEAWKSKIFTIEERTASEILSLKRDIEKLKSQLEAEVTARSKWQTEKAMMEKKNEYLIELKEKILRLSNVSDGLETKQKEFQGTLMTLKESINDSTEKAKSLLLMQSKAGSDLIAQLQMEQEKYIALERELKVNKQLVEELNEKLEELKAAVTDVTRMYEGEMEKVKYLQKENAMLNDQIMNKAEQSNDVLANLKKSINELQVVMDMKQKEIILLKEKKKALEGELNKLKEQLEEKEKSLNHSLLENASLFSKMEKLKVEIKTNEKVIEEKVAMIEKLKKELGTLEQKDDEIKELTSKLQQYTDIDTKQKILAAKESKINEVIKKVESVYESFQCNLTCLVCGEISQKCTLCIPCGHCFCNPCIQKSKVCPNCSEKIQAIYESKMLDEIACKFSYSKKMVDVFKDETCWKFIK